MSRSGSAICLRIISSICRQRQLAARVARRVELHRPHFCVQTIVLKQLIMGPLFGNDTFFQYNDIVGIADRSESMGNHQDGTFRTKSIQGILDAILGQSIQRRCSFVEQDKRRILE